MAKHIAPPATAEKIMRTLGVTQEDIELVERVLKELEEEEPYEGTGRDGRLKLEKVKKPDPE
jgi:hypothetical protein